MQESGNTPGHVPEAQTSIVEDGKTIAIIAYITVIGLVIALVMNQEKKNSFARFHIRQSLGIMLTGLVTSVLSWIPILGWILAPLIFIFLFILWIMGLMNAVSGREKTVPLLGDKYAEWFKTI